MKFIRFFLLIIFRFSASAQGINADSIWTYANYYKTEDRVPMRDGIRLFTAVYVPKDSTEKHPILLMRTPYSCAPYGKSEFIKFWEGYLRYYLQEGYIIALQDVRGRWMSEGKFEDIRPFIKHKKPGDTDESTDAYDAIDWLVKTVPGNNGKVGVLGTSYPVSMPPWQRHPVIRH